MSINNKIEKKNEDQNYITWLSELFARIGVWCYDHRWLVLAISIMLMGVSVWLASTLRIDSGFESYFDRDDEAYKSYLQFREDFGSDENIFLLYEVPDREHGVFDVDVMQTIHQLSKAIEREVPFVKEVTSLSNAEITQGVADGLEITSWERDYTHDQAGALLLRDRIRQKPLYLGGLLSDNGRYAAVLVDMDRASTDSLDKIRFDPAANNPDALENLYPQVANKKLNEILARPEYAQIRFHVSGDVPINTVMNTIVQDEGVMLGGISFALIASILLVFFQFRLSGLIGPLTVVFCSIIVTVGFMGAIGWRWDMLSGMMPTLLTAMGVGAAVHMMSEFWQAYEKLGDRREAVRETLYLVGVPCLLTSATTAAAFVATAISPIKALEHLSWYSAFGVMATFFFSITLLILFMSFGKSSTIGKHPVLKKLTDRNTRTLRRLADFNVRHQNGVIIFFGLLFLVSLWGTSLMRVDSNFLEEFSDRVPVKHTTLLVDEVMGGTGGLVYLFDAGEADGIKDPEFLKELERVQDAAKQDTHFVKKTYSIVDLLKDINQSFHGGDPAYYVIPENRELVAQLLLVYEMSGGEELEEYVSSDYSRANLEIRCRNTDTSKYQAFHQRMENYLTAHPLKQSTVTLTGIGRLWIQLAEYIIKSQVFGFGLAFIIITGMMCFVYRSFRIGFVSMLPNMSPIFLTLGFMGFAGIDLDYTKLLIATISVGIVVDDSIHFVTRFHHEFDRCGNYRLALYGAFDSVGRAVTITTVVLVCGFMVFTLSLLDSMRMFGLLSSMTFAIALVAEFLLMPVLIMKLKLFGEEFTSE
jgi:predicted RND superfamily exporter protein